MKKIIPIALIVMAFATAPDSAWGDRGRVRIRVPNIDGAWYMNGDDNLPCQVIQRRGDGRVLFINENGSRAGGVIRGDRVFIPDWSDGVSDGLVGRIRGDRIIWPNGSFWSR